MLSKEALSTIIESLEWLDLGLNPCLLSHWRTLLWHNNEHSCAYIYIYICCVWVCVCVYIYIYIYECAYVGLCVFWMAGGIISSIFEAAPECLEDLPLSILARRPHKKLCSREPARPEEGTKDVWELRVRLQNRESDYSSPGRGAGHSALRRESRAVGGCIESRTKTQSSEDVDQRWVSIYGSCVGFSLSPHDTHI